MQQTTRKGEDRRNAAPRPRPISIGLTRTTWDNKAGARCIIQSNDRGREDRLSSVSPPSEPYVRFSRIRLSG